MIKNARNKKKITQRELAKKLNVSQSYMSKIENRKTKTISVDLILNLSSILEIDPVELFIFLADLYNQGK
jgi:transcriptional regulator with XRE-family HTH domain|nr:MAG TPA: Helix-turn-helix XRE-family like protein [Caudoviricetes sp.]